MSKLIIIDKPLPCPDCGLQENKVHFSSHGNMTQVECACGYSGPMAKGYRLAVERWNMICKRDETGINHE